MRQGERGDAFFVIRSGRWHVTQEHPSGRRERVAELGPPDAFGEMALLGDGTRRFTVSAVDGGELLVLSSAAFDQAVAATGLPRAEVTDWVQTAQWLGRCRLFSGMTAAQQARFLRQSTRRRVPAGQTLIRQGDVGETFYVILTGHVRVTSPDGTALAELGPSDHVGEVALLTAAPRNATVTAAEDVVALELGREAFLQALVNDFHFGLAVSDAARVRSEVGP